MKPESLGWFKAMRGNTALELIRTNANAFTLAFVIAHRARWREGFNQYGLGQGEAMLGDFENYGMSQREYRTAKQQLAKWGFATFRTTNAGTIAKLTDTRLFSTATESADKPNDNRPTTAQQATDKQPTTNEELKKEKQEEACSTKGKAIKPGKLSAREKEIADRFEAVLGVQWGNDAGKWVGRIRTNTGKCERVVAEVENALKEGRVETTPAQYAEQIWKEFA